MRLLNVDSYELEFFDDGFIGREPSAWPRYAILSHRWCSHEITFDDIGNTRIVAALRDPYALDPTLSHFQDALHKIRGACAKAKEHGHRWVWIDSCCINKNIDAEEQSSIRSMYSWYRKAQICLVFLADVLASNGNEQDVFACVDQTDRTHSEWFERGWTLQELLAPSKCDFHDMHWTSIGSRRTLAPQINSLTGISMRYLDGSTPLSRASAAQRISWQAHRKTKVPEDIVYSLAGILQVTIWPNYNEGVKAAFRRLQEQVVKRQLDESLFAWTVPEDGPSADLIREQDNGTWGLLAPGIDCFQSAGDIMIPPEGEGRPGGIRKIARGVSIPMPTGDLFEYELENKVRDCGIYLLLMLTLTGCFFALYQVRRHREQRHFTLTLDCWRTDPSGNIRPLTVCLTRVSDDDSFWKRCRCDTLGFRHVRPAELAKRIKASGTGWENVTVLQPEDRYED